MLEGTLSTQTIGRQARACIGARLESRRPLDLIFLQQPAARGGTSFRPRVARPYVPAAALRRAGAASGTYHNTVARTARASRPSHTQRRRAPVTPQHSLTVNPPPQKLAVALACLPVAAAFVAPAAPGASVKVQETKADLEALAVKLNPVVGFYDPLGAVHKSNFGAFRRSTDYELSIYLM